GAPTSATSCPALPTRETPEHYRGLGTSCHLGRTRLVWSDGVVCACHVRIEAARAAERARHACLSGSIWSRSGDHNRHASALATRRGRRTRKTARRPAPVGRGFGDSLLDRRSAPPGAG